MSNAWVVIVYCCFALCRGVVLRLLLFVMEVGLVVDVVRQQKSHKKGINRALPFTRIYLYCVFCCIVKKCCFLSLKINI